MARSASLYDRRDKFAESSQAVRMASKAGLLSIGLYLAVIWVFLFVASNLFAPDSRPNLGPTFRVQMIGDENLTPLVDNRVVPSGQVAADRNRAETAASDSTPIQWADIINNNDIPIEDEVIEAPDVRLENTAAEIGRKSSPPQFDVPGLVKDKPVQTSGQATDSKSKADSASGLTTGDTTVASGSSDGLWLDPERVRYYAALQGLVRRNWSWISTVSQADRELETILEVVIQPDGRITLVQMLVSSGNEGFDRSIIKAILASNPFPVLPPIFGGQATTVVFSFKPLEMLKLQTH